MNLYMQAIVGGGLIGLSAALLLLFSGRVAGVSGICPGPAVVVVTCKALFLPLEWWQALLPMRFSKSAYWVINQCLTMRETYGGRGSKRYIFPKDIENLKLIHIINKYLLILSIKGLFHAP